MFSVLVRVTGLMKFTIQVITNTDFKESPKRMYLFLLTCEENH